MPKPEPVKTLKQIKAEKEQEERKSLVEFSLANQYDLESFWGRFQCNFDRSNPLLFFTPHAQILEARDKIYKHKLREEAAHNLGQKVYLKPEEVAELKRAD